MELGNALLQMAQAPAKPPFAVSIQRLNQAIAACPHENLKQQMLQTLAEMLQNMGPRFSQLMGERPARGAWQCWPGARGSPSRSVRFRLPDRPATPHFHLP